MDGINFSGFCFCILAVSAPLVVLGEQNETLADKSVEYDDWNRLHIMLDTLLLIVCAAAASCVLARLALAYLQRKLQDSYNVLEEADVFMKGNTHFYRKFSCMRVTKRTPFLEDEEALCGTKEPSKQQVLFKRTIDATLSKTELANLCKTMKSVGILYWNNQGTGTVIRIGPNFIITAWHVIKQIVMPPGNVTQYGSNSAFRDYNNLKKEGIYADFRDNTAQSNTELCFGLLPKICFLDEDLDICVLELTGNSGNFPEPISVFRDFESMHAREKITRFVHVIGQHQKKQSLDDNKFQTAKKWVEEHRNDIMRYGLDESEVLSCYNDMFKTQDNLIISTYLEFGASGGAVVSITPDGEVALVAMLLRGLPNWYWDKYNSERGFPTSVRMEVGCLITHILKSEHWIVSERQSIFENMDSKKEEGTQMETDEPNFKKEGETQIETDEPNFKTEGESQMETDVWENEAVVNKMT